MTLRVCANRIAQAGPQYSLIPEAEVPLISRGTLSQALRSATAEAAGEALETEVDSAAADQLSTYRERDGEAGTAELREYQSFLGRLQGFRTHLVAQLHDNALGFIAPSFRSVRRPAGTPG